MQNCSRPLGRTRWPRLLAILTVTSLAAGGLLGGVAAGAVGVSFTGVNPFTVVATRIDSDSLSILPGLSAGSVSLIAKLPAAEISGLCKAATVTLPVVGAVTTILRADKVKATDLVLDIKDINGDVDLKQLLLGAATPGAPVGYRSSRVSLTNVTIKAGSVAAGTFAVSGLHLENKLGAHGCPAPGAAR